MAFDTKKIFDRVKGAANDVAGAVSDLGEKTGNKIDEMKLTARISDLRKEINNIYLEIGKGFCEYEGGTILKTQFAPQLEAVAEREKMIKDLEGQISVIRGGKTCSGCGQRCSESDSFWPNCGKEL